MTHLILRSLTNLDKPSVDSRHEGGGGIDDIAPPPPSLLHVLTMLTMWITILPRRFLIQGRCPLRGVSPRCMYWSARNQPKTKSLECRRCCPPLNKSGPNNSRIPNANEMWRAVPSYFRLALSPLLRHNHALDY